MKRQKIEQRIEELKLDLDGYHALPMDLRAMFEGKGEAKLEEITFLQSLLDEEEQPLDAPTHSGWWFVEGFSRPVDFHEKTKLVFNTERGMWEPMEFFQEKHPGKWLPANNPFGKGEG